MNNRRLALDALLAGVMFLPLVAQAQSHRSITFANGAGRPALVKLIGPSARTVAVPQSESRSESGIAPGHYYILVRYGDREEDYSYMKGDSFDIEESGNEYSEISITLYTVVDGNYASRPARKEEFEKVP